MQESFDIKLRNKIRNVFDNYYEPVNPADWELMKEKLTNKNNRRIIWLNNIAKAASVVLIVGISVMIPHSLNNYIKDESSFKNETIKENQNNLFAQDSILKENEIKRIIENEFPVNKKQNNKADENGENEFIIRKTQNNETAENQIKNNNFIKDTLINKVINELIAVNTLNNDTTDLLSKDTANKTQIVRRDTLKKINQKPILLADDDYFINTKKEKKEKRFNIGVAFSTHYNYSDQIASNTVNVGGGLLSEFKITDRLSINSGLLISKHGLAHNSFGKKDEAVSSGPECAPNSVEYTRQKGQSEIEEASFVGIDIPLNLQYNIKRFFVSAGVSSLVYLKENYKNRRVYTVYNERYDSDINETVYDNIQVSKIEEESYGAFQTFDFAKLLNISLGYKIPLKRGKIIVEPYIKIPMGKLATKNISFGFGGISLKYNFR